MLMHQRPFRGSHRKRLDRLQRYATFASLLNSTSFAKALQSEQQPIIIDVLNDNILFTDDESVENLTTASNDAEDSRKQLKQSNHFAYGSSCGLYNPGQNICFMNAVIQTLINLPYITPCLLKGIHKSNCKLRAKSLFCSLCLLESLAQKAHSIKGAVNNPFFSITKKAIWSKYVPGRQQDSHEFLRYLVESFSTPMGAKHTPDSYKKSLIGQAFHGILKSTVRCLQCKYSSGKLEPFLDIALDLTRESLENCISEFIKPQKLTGSNKYHCPKCKNKRDAVLSLAFNKLPLVMCIALKRFNFSIFGLEKTLKSINYPKEMVLNGIEYELSALVCHLGHSLYSGHYISYAKGGHGFWNKFDDSHISFAELKQVLEQTKSAYLLFYVQKNVTDYEQLLVNESSISQRAPASDTLISKGANVAKTSLNRNNNDNTKNDKVENDLFNPFMRMEKSKDLSSQYGVHEISTWDGIERDSEAIRKHGEKTIPKIAEKDKVDIEYDMGKLKKIRNKQIFKGTSETLGNSKTKQIVVHGKVDFDKLKNKNPNCNKRNNYKNTPGVNNKVKKQFNSKKWKFQRKKWHK